MLLNPLFTPAQSCLSNCDIGQSIFSIALLILVSFVWIQTYVVPYLLVLCMQQFKRLGAGPSVAQWGKTSATHCRAIKTANIAQQRIERPFRRLGDWVIIYCEKWTYERYFTYARSKGTIKRSGWNCKILFYAACVGASPCPRTVSQMCL